ncbi:hypothetical protein F4802DRAFT_458713 [Xylaria palmicola]|nr:hypothetical protein F4802DRAFT_458713 [Xylaria palmicola]
MEDEGLVHKVRALGDVDLAALLCLISREHCIISTDPEYLDALTAELQLVASRTFGLSSAVVDCAPETTLDDLVTAIQLRLPQPQPAPAPRTPSPLHARGSESNNGTQHDGGDLGAHSQQQQHQLRITRPPSSLAPNASATPASPSRSSLLSAAIPQQQIANVILARNLNTAPKAVQIQCLELMRTRRIFTRTTVLTCPKQFLLVAVLGSEGAGQARLTKHLNDHFYISHWQDPEDGFPHLNEDEDERNGDVDANDNPDRNLSGAREDDDEDTASQASSASVVRRTLGSKTPSTPLPSPAVAATGSGHLTSTTDWAMQNQRAPQVTDDHTNSSTERGALFSETEISMLAARSLQTHVDVEVQRYLMNIVAFLRLHRAVRPGSVPPAATTHFRKLVHSLAALHGLDSATPELVQLAARKIYAHHLAIVAPERERSMQWGSDLAAVEALLEGVQPEDVVEDILGMVDAPF